MDIEKTRFLKVGERIQVGDFQELLLGEWAEVHRNNIGQIVNEISSKSFRRKVDNSKILISEASCIHDIEHLIDIGTFPIVFGNTLKRIVASHVEQTNPTTAYTYDIERALKYVSKGIDLMSKDGSITSYEIFVFRPFNPILNRTFFYLLPKFPGGQLVPLDKALA